MNTRNFHAVPNLSRGFLAPITESKLIHGVEETKFDGDECRILPETNYNRFVPFTPCVNEHVLGFNRHQINNRAGINTREYTRKFMRKCK